MRRMRTISPALAVAAAMIALQFVFPGPAGAQGSAEGARPGVAVLVLDAQSGEPLADVRVRLATRDTLRVLDQVTGSDGWTEFHVPPDSYAAEASRLGYKPERREIDYTGGPPVRVTLRLEPRVLPGPEIEVSTTRATERRSAVAFTDLSRGEIDRKYWAQDVPMLLAETPSVYAYSDAGNGVGYSYVKIRGFSQRRVGVTINGIPLNDPQSHEVYWVDHPDLLASTQNLQVQRGVGSALYGASAVGGSINLETLDFPETRRFSVETGAGSYGTTRFATEYQSGLLENRYALAARYSRIVSQGYRDQSWSRLWSYYVSAGRRDSWITTRVNLYGGPERLHLAYYAVDRSYLDGRITGDASRDRRYNPLEWRNETDNYFEPHYELIQDVKLSPQASFTSSAFYFPGSGYYDDFPYGPQPFASRHLPDFEVDSDSLYPASYYATDSLGVPAVQSDGRYLVTGSDMTQRLWVRNRHYGWIPRARVAHGNGTLTVGGEWRESQGRHWGELTWAQALPPGTTPDHVMYDYTGRVNVWSGFAQESYLVWPDLRLTGSLQYRRVRYAIGDDRYNGYDFHLDYDSWDDPGEWSLVRLPLNPRVGLNWNATDRWNAFGGFAHVVSEPILTEIYRADDPASVPLFRRIDVARHIYEDPLIRPERLNDYEVGVGYRAPGAQAKVTGFLLDFRNEIVPSGAIDPYGVPITGNAGRSSHVGLELEGLVRHRGGLELSGNVSLSRNRFDEYREYVYDYAAGAIVDTLDHSGNTIALFPSRMANVTVGYRRGGAGAGLTLVATGKQYLDNTEDNRKDPALRAAPGYQKKLIPEHAVLNANLTLDLTALQSFLGARRVTLDFRVLNLTDLHYETSGYVYDEIPYFYPAAGRNAFVSLKAEF
jgi:iron complex outermembrane recepter protein